MEKIDFCPICRKETEYVLKKIAYKPSLRTKRAKLVPFFPMTIAICKECGNEVLPPGLLDKNIKEFIAANEEVLK